jgi:DtxR family transcriptional regulator, Mn-dependent transcriptional regulator
MENNMASSKVEDYLKAIYELEEKEGLAKTTLLAEKLGIQAGTVSEMIKRLSKASPRLITYKHHYGVRLTIRGKKAALGVIRRHRLLETFLHQTLGLSWDEVHEEAEVLEHHISDRVTDSIDRHLNFPGFDPHGEPIPDRAGNISTQSQLSLSEIQEGQIFKIIAVNPVSSEFLLYLENLGIEIHSSGRVISKSPLDGLVKIRINQKSKFNEHTLGSNITDQIYVDQI